MESRTREIRTVQKRELRGQRERGEEIGPERRMPNLWTSGSQQSEQNLPNHNFLPTLFRHQFS